MIKFIFSLLLCVITTTSFSQNTIATAIPIAHGENMQATILQNSITTYYRTLLPTDGTIKIYVEGKKTSGTTGGFGFYAYDLGGRNIGSKTMGSDVAVGTSFRDTLTIFSRSADSLRFLINNPSQKAFDISFRYEIVDRGDIDAEPNNHTRDAIFFSSTQSARGSIGYIRNGQFDSEDYFKTFIPANGSVRVILEGKHTGGSAGSFGFYAYDWGGRTVFSKSAIGHSVTYGETVKDTITIYSQNADSLYFLIHQPAARSFQYKIDYEVTEQSPADQEPNNIRSQALKMAAGEKIQGQIGYIKNGVSDSYDYYITRLPENGTVQLILEGKHTGGSTGSFGFYAYDQGGRTVFSKSAIGHSVSYGETVKDTITIYSQNADSLYFLIYQPGARSFQYKMDYKMIPPGASDQEPNNTSARANYMAAGQKMEGQIGYVSNGVLDNNDYYKTMLPGDGTVRLYFEAEHTGGSKGSFAFYAYDQGGRTLMSKTLVGKSIELGQKTMDTIEIVSRQADSIYFLIYMNTSRSMKYSFHYEMTDQSINDEEPNNSASTAGTILAGQQVQGHIGYTANGMLDNHDYYRTGLPEDGTIQIIIEGKHTGGSTGSFGFYARDEGGRTLFSKASLGRNIDRGEIFRDTLHIVSQGADSIYFYVYQPASRSFSYTFSYSMLRTSENDAEPNNTRNTATLFSEGQTMVGHIGNTTNGILDSYDYYKTLLPTDGTIEIFIKGTHTGGSNGSFGFYATDHFGRNIFSKSSLGSPAAIDADVFDTLHIYSRAADTILFYVYQPASRSFNYEFSYRMIDTSANDIAPNESFGTATIIDAGELVRGHSGYIKNGISDVNDYFKTLLPADGSVTIFVEAEHTGGSNGSFGFYVYDLYGRTIFSKGSLGTGTIAKGDIVRDTITIDSRAADSLVFLIYNPAARSFSYQFRYEMPQALESDPEPNNTFNQAVRVNNIDTIKGLIGYVQTGVADVSDYYKTAVPRGSSVKIYIEGEHTGGNSGSFGFYAYDDSRRNLFTKGSLGSGQVSRGEKFFDTVSVNCINSDSLFLLVYQPSARSFAYKVYITVEDNRPEAKFTHAVAGSLHEFVNQSANAMNYIWQFPDTVMNDRIAPPLKALSPGNHIIRLIAQNSSCNFRDTMELRLVVNGLDRYTPERSGPGNVQFTAYGGGFHPGMELTLRNGGAIFRDSLSEVSSHGNVFATLIDMHDAPVGIYDIEIKTKDTTYKIPGGYRIDALVDRLKTEITGRDIIRVNTTAPYSVRVINEGNTMAGLTEVHVLFPMYMNVKFVDSLIDIVQTKFVDLDLDTVAFPRIVTKAKNGYPIDGKLFSFYIAGIPAGGYRDLNFSVSSGSGTQSIYTWVVGPGSGSKYKGWFDPCNKAKMKMVLDALLDAANVIPVVDCALSSIRFLGSSIYANVASKLGYGDPSPVSVGKSLAGLTKNCAGELLTGAGFAPGIAVEIADVLADLGIMASNAHLNAAMVRDACNDQPEEEDEKPVEVLQSFDPNAKSGPSGFGKNHYINGFDKIMNYTIFFENIDTATLPAQMVQIVDTLDKSVFDLSSFRTFNFTVSGKKYQLPMGALDYSMDIPFNDELGIRFSVKLDTASGVMTAVMKTLDNETGALTDDPLAGFLPPNKNAPEGEGSISFAINLKEGLSDGTVIRNKASIIFDTNEPIITEEWINTIDRNAPSSKVIELTQSSDTTVLIRINGADPASGIKKYRLFAAEDNGDFKYVGDIKGDTATFTGVNGKTYDFYAVAVDNVSNRETKNAGSEARISLKTSVTEPVSNESLLAYPIPSRGTITVEVPIADAQQVNISIFSSTGERAAELFNGNANGPLKITRQISNLPSGIYFVRVKGSKGLNLYKKIVLAK